MFGLTVLFAVFYVDVSLQFSVDYEIIVEKTTPPPSQETTSTTTSTKKSRCRIVNLQHSKPSPGMFTV
jgi:hypothetical protein